MKNLIIFQFLAICFFLTSCDPRKDVKPDEQPTVNLKTSSDILLYYYQMFDEFENCNGSVYLQNFNTLPTQEFENEVFASAEFYQNKPARIRDDRFNSFLLNNNNLIKIDKGSFWLSNKEMNNLYGTKINSSFSNVNQNTQIGDIYVPKKLRVSISPDLGGHNFEISSNTVIRWNTDEQNSQGLVIKIEYLPEMNKQEIRQNFPKPILKFVGIQDIGEYQLRSQDLEGLPTKANVSISVIRGVAKLSLFENNSKSFMTIAYHEVSAGGVVK